MKKRTFGEFLKSQEDHVKKVNDKIERVRCQRESEGGELLKAPEINKKSAKLIEKKRHKERELLSCSNYIAAR